MTVGGRGGGGRSEATRHRAALFSKHQLVGFLHLHSETSEIVCFLSRLFKSSWLSLLHVNNEQHLAVSGRLHFLHTSALMLVGTFDARRMEAALYASLGLFVCNYLPTVQIPVFLLKLRILKRQNVKPER